MMLVIRILIRQEDETNTKMKHKKHKKNILRKRTHIVRLF